MAKILIGQDYGSYTFDKVAKTVTINLPSGKVKLEGLLMITDTTNNTIIYQFNDPLKGATLLGNVFTLTFNTNTVAFNNTDKLQIFYYDEQPISEQMNDMSMAIRQLYNLIQRPSYIESTTYLRTKSYGGYLDSISTVNTVATISFIGPVSRILEEVSNPNRITAWQLSVRNKIT